MSVMTADILSAINSPESEEVLIDLPPAAQPRYEEGDTYVFEVKGVQVVETVNEVDGQVVHWGDDNGNTWATLHDPILQPISEIEISRRYSQAALHIFPLQKGRTSTFTVFEMPRDGNERRRVENCLVEGAVRVTVKAGEFDTYRVRCKRRNYNETMYYAPRVGHVVKFIREGSVADGVTELVTHRRKSDPKPAIKPAQKPAMKPQMTPDGERETSSAVEPEMKPQMKPVMQASDVSKMYVDSEIAQVSIKVADVSDKIDDVSDKVDTLVLRVDNLAERIDNLPRGGAMMAPKPGTPEMLAPMTTPSASDMSAMDKSAETAMPAQATKPPKKLAATEAMAEAKPKTAEGPKRPYWGIQVGVYKTRESAETSWAKLLANPAAIELNDATVNYVELTRKDGKKLQRIIINEYAGKKPAQAACKALKKEGVDCWAVLIK